MKITKNFGDSWFALWAALCTLASACAFYADMLRKTAGEWSAPLDDVFIHFDFARSIAMGFVGQWVPGNGYSSGATSMLYPFLLAPGWAIGFRGSLLMAWAAWVACLSVFFTLLNLDRIAAEWTPGADAGRFARRFLLPLCVLMCGGLSWSFWSGMEVALYAALSSRAMLAWVRARHGASVWPLALLGVLCVMARPEAVTAVALFALSARVNISIKHRVRTALQVGAPAAALVVLQAVVNRALTGETSAYGALVKLAAYSPQLSVAEKIADYQFNLTYAFLRPFEHHLSDNMAASALLVLLAFAATVRGPRAILARFLALHIIAWCLLVATNGQVRWQNERYLMPAVVWLLFAATLGASELASMHVRGGKALQLARELGLGLALTFVAAHQVGKWQDQKWFFGQASQNIRDQQTRLGRWLRLVGRQPGAVGLADGPHRVALSDAGAIPYASGWPALDMMGLGGYKDLPFARASGHELPAVLELIERMPARERPDVLAIFPSWWPTLPVWFSSGVLERFQLNHNVICGDFEHVAYRADWSLLGTGEAPLGKPSGTEMLVDTLDIADLVSEKSHKYVLPSPLSGKTRMHVLEGPAHLDVWDAGRFVPAGAVERFELQAPPSASSMRATVVVRLATPTATKLLLDCGGNVEQRDVEASEHWTEVAVPIQLNASGAAVCRLSSEGTAHESFHVFLFQ